MKSLTKGRNILLVYIISIKSVRGGKVMRYTKRKNRKKDNKGITLIALIVTIIVILILAGASIAMMTGDNRHFDQSCASKNRYR